jgi:hypothetical protein
LQAPALNHSQLLHYPPLSQTFHFLSGSQQETEGFLQMNK